jgi:hypothetical protein
MANPTQTDALEINEAEDGLVVFDPSRDAVHHQNASASLVFELCDGTRDPDAIAVLVGEAFGLAEPPRDETRAGLEDLAERGLIRWDRHAA